MNTKNFFIAAIVLIAVAIFANRPAKFDYKNEAKMPDFPKIIGEWEGADIPLSERDYEILETRNLVMRDYKNKQGESVYLYIIYSVDNRRALHPPEVCYTGGGATILRKSVIPLGSLGVNEFIVEYKNSRQLVAYWFKSTDLNTYSYLKQQLKIVTDHLLGRKTSGAMIRLSTEIGAEGETASLKLIKEFGAQIEPLLNKYIP